MARRCELVTKSPLPSLIGRNRKTCIGADNRRARNRSHGGGIMSSYTRHLRFVVLNVAALLTLLIASRVASAQTPSATGGQTAIENPSSLVLYIATLEGSLDWGDQAPDWSKQLAIYGSEPKLLFRWRIYAPTATKGRWQISSDSGTPLAQGEVAAAQTPGDYAYFSLNVPALGISPPFTIAIQALTSNGADVGFMSSPVVFNHAVNTGWGMCFTDGGLGFSIAERLEAIRAARGLPALGGAVVTKYGMETFDAVGLRKIGATSAVTKYDKWHLGSDTKAMTSILVGILHEYFPNTLDWDTTIADVFPEWAGTMHPTMAQTTVRTLLAHRSGLYYFTQEQDAKLVDPNVSVTQRRRNFTHAVVHDPYLLAPGGSWIYQNANYIIVAAMLEKLFTQSWENLITYYLFQPLGATSAGFDPPALTADSQHPQPWGHGQNNGSFVPTNGDNPQSARPAGGVHASLSDWGKFIRLYLNGHEGGVTLTSATLTELTTPYTSDNPWFALWNLSYGWGWGIDAVTGALAHDGSNGGWYARAIVYPSEGYAILAVTNSAQPAGATEVLTAMSATVLMLENYYSACGNRTQIRIPLPGGSR
jgi:D-alanyl-D-alanine carboxypeptidase